MHFEYPAVFLLVVLFLFCERRCPLRLDLLYFPGVGRVSRLTRKTALMQALKWMAWSGLFVAMASQVSVERYPPDLRSGRDLVLVVDASRSMGERFSVVQTERKFDELKRVLQAFIERRRGDRLGMVLFGEYAYVVSPLTFDHRILAAMVPYLSVGMAGERTAITDALAMAAKLLGRGEAESRVAVLITDGKNTAGRVPLPVVRKLLQQEGIRLYTIGVGTEGAYNAKMLKALAKATGGGFYEASDAKTLAEVYAKIDRLEPSDLPDMPVVRVRYWYSYPLFVAAMALLGYLFLLNRAEVA